MKSFKHLLTFAILISFLQWQLNTKAADLFDAITSGEIVLTTLDQQLLTAIESEDMNGIGFLLALGANPNANTFVNQYFEIVFNPVIITAVQTGNLEIVRLLLDVGADPTAVNSEDGNTALMIARRNGYEEIVSLLEAAINKFNASDKISDSDKLSDSDRENLAIEKPEPKDEFKARAAYRAHIKKQHGRKLEVAV